MNLFLASDPRPVHFVGIAGAGMSALAQVALLRGVAVTGSDKVPAGAPDLLGLGASVWEGHDARHVVGARAVIVSAAIPPDNPEVRRARELGLPVVPRKEALASLLAGRRIVAVAGTHGKTTTTAMTTEALAAAGLDPTGLAGGRVALWQGNARLGGDEWYVVEADEFDRAFLALAPTIAVITNVEPEHLESYGESAEQLRDAFATFGSRAGRAIIGSGGDLTEQVAVRVTAPIWRYGRSDARASRPVAARGPASAAYDLAVGSIAASAEGSTSELRLPDGRRVALRVGVPGEHNVLNATAAVGAVLAAEAALAPALEALARFAGVERRFDVLGAVAGVTVVDDYAHHPTEIAATLSAARGVYPGRRLVAVFQPHLYTRTARLADRMGEALAAADRTFVTAVYPAREAPIPGVGGHLVAEAARARGAWVELVEDRAALLERIRDEVRADDIVLTLGAGDITTLGPDLLSRLRAP